MPEIVLDKLVKRYGHTAAANGLSLTVKDGEYLCILGPTGAGKTTCLRMICGLTKQDSGTVSFDGKEIDKMPVSERQTTMLSQVYSLFPPLTVYENVMFSPTIKEWPEDDSKKLVKSMIKMVHMDHKVQQYPHELSGGQQQRTALARALASDSKVLLLDEPLRALDARLRLELRKELKSMTKELKLTAIHVTHDQDEALEMADRIAIIRHGSFVQVGTPIEIFQNPATPFVANFVGRSNIFTGKIRSTCEGYTEVEIGDGKIIKARKTDIPVDTDVVVAIKIGSTKIEHMYDPTEEDLEEIIPEGYFEGEIERILYEGATVTVEMISDGVGRVITKIPNRKYDDYAIKDRVMINWVPDMAVIFNVPECGIEEELRLD
ncbi:MAG: ABC transporter ATP-binding protein [Candidatus Methanogranum gryphiswaldense]|nr:MAG: ABC transporter ATP-binding protein [Candidatus Methanogranum sp. U3.2.1]